MASQLKLFLMFYYRPVRAASRTLDDGRLSVAIITALLVAMIMRGPVFGMLVAVAVLFAPASLIVVTLWEGRSSMSVGIQRDYVPLLLCLLTAWSAANLPAALGTWFGWRWMIPAAWLWFMALSACCLRTVPGTSWGRAIVGALAGFTVTLGGFWLSFLFGNVFYLLASPLVLYFLYLRFGGDLASLGSGFQERQSFQRHLEATTLNPRDADAHYQLGLIYLERRNLDEAEARFRKAVEIDGEDADFLFQLGRLLSERGRPGEAVDLLDRAARLNDRLATNEVWVEIGAARLALGQTEEALAALAKYVARREYDPRGLVLYGQALRAAGQGQEARHAFRQAIEAAETMPGYRRGEVRRWKNMAKEELGR